MRVSERRRKLCRDEDDTGAQALLDLQVQMPRWGTLPFFLLAGRARTPRWGTLPFFLLAGQVRTPRWGALPFFLLAGRARTPRWGTLPGGAPSHSSSSQAAGHCSWCRREGKAAVDPLAGSVARSKE